MFFHTAAIAFEANYDTQYFNKGVIHNKIKMGITENIYIYNKISLFADLNIFNTRGINGQDKNYFYNIGLKFTPLIIGKNALFFVFSYHKTISYNELLHFTHLDEIYNKVKAGVVYNHNNNFSAGAFYSEFFDSYKNSLNFFAEKTLLKNNYFESRIGYEHYKNIGISNEPVLYNYNNILYSLQTRKLLNEEDVLYWNIKTHFVKHTNVSTEIRLIDSKIYGRYSSASLKFGFETW
jgi:hypothetical protein